jgi:hypothetical protein
MNPQEEFLRHAADCEQMAKFTHDKASRLTWNRMAERWRQCAWKFESQGRSGGPNNASAKRHRRHIALGWAPR